MTKEEIKSLIMDEFRRTNCKVGHCVPLRTYRMGLLRRLNPKEQELAEDAFNELQEEGFIEYKSDGLEAFALTQLGFDGLYDCRSDEELEDIVLSKFRRMNCREGQGYMTRILQNEYSRLNPIEQDRLNELYDKLVEDGFIEESGNDFIKLTRKGFDRIY